MILNYGIIVALSIFLELYGNLENLFPNFIKLCDEDIRKKSNR